MAEIAEFLAQRRALLRDYATAISGSVGRLVFSLAYFVLLANTLTIAEFGVFATASGAGVMLSRIVAFGFVTGLYRIATVKPLLVGVFTAGFLVMALVSLPVLAAAAWLTWRLFFAGDVGFSDFAVVIVAEAIFWRMMEVTVIVNNGMNRFARAAVLVITGTMLRAGAALVFAFAAAPTLATWVWFYLAANAAAMLVGLVLFHPRRRLRFKPALYWPRLADSLYVAGAEILFYLQMEMDKLLVLALGGPRLAGIYAIIMRLVDLTAIPVRTFTMMLVQRMMRAPEMLASLSRRALVEAGIFTVSTAGLLALALMLWIEPRLLGSNVAEAAPLVVLALCVPGLRNLVEYHAELLFARGQTLLRAVNLALLAGLKALLLTWLLLRIDTAETLVPLLNPVFLVLYIASAALTYTAIKLPAKSV